MSLVTDYLNERGVGFEVLPHRRAFTSLQEARAVGVAAEEVLKTVGLWTEGKYVLAVVPASRRLELRLVRDALEDSAARLATEAELAADFPGYELGALPPPAGDVRSKPHGHSARPSGRAGNGHASACGDPPHAGMAQTAYGHRHDHGRS